MSSARSKPASGLIDQLELPLGSGQAKKVSDKEESPAPAVEKKKKSLRRKQPSEKTRTYSWIVLHEARSKNVQPVVDEPSTPIGRPPRPLPVKQTTVTYSAGDEEALKEWQAIFAGLLNRKPSLGETAGILAKLCLERKALIDDGKGYANLLDLVKRMTGGPEDT